MSHGFHMQYWQEIWQSADCVRDSSDLTTFPMYHSFLIDKI